MISALPLFSRVHTYPQYYFLIFQMFLHMQFFHIPLLRYFLIKTFLVFSHIYKISRDLVSEMFVCFHIFDNFQFPKIFIYIYTSFISLIFSYNYKHLCCFHSHTTSFLPKMFTCCVS